MGECIKYFQVIFMETERNFDYTIALIDALSFKCLVFHGIVTSLPILRDSNGS